MDDRHRRSDQMEISPFRRVCLVNAALVRATLAPLYRLQRLMDDVDLLRPGQRLPEKGNGPVGDVIRTFDAMLDRLEAERATSTGRALAAQEGGRRRVAQELHDEVGQSLTVVLLGLRRVADRAPADLAPGIGIAQETARASLDEVRHVVRRLSPGVLDDPGPFSALTSLLSTHARLAGAAVHQPLLASPRAGDRIGDLPRGPGGPDRRRPARRCRAGPRRARSDRGRSSGAAPDRGRRPGRGRERGGGRRPGMRERALLVGSTLDISTSDTGGTDVRLLVPTRACEARS